LLRRRLRLPSLSTVLTTDLASEWADCAHCALSASRSVVVAGEGPMPAELMLVADAPGFHDDRLGRPLVAAAGELLADLLASIGLERRDVYVTTLVKCRPPGTQSPAPEEIAACRDKLERQVELVRPRVVAALGDLATRALAGAAHGVSQTHGQVRRGTLAGREITLLPLYHPAAALHNARLLPPLEADVARLGELLGRASVARRPAARPSAGDAAVTEADEQQLGLF
jgi:DNA polymerase